MYKILVICPYVGLKDVFEKVNKDFKKNIDIEVGNLYDGLTIAKSLEYKGYDAMISRGATATILREHFSIPVLDVKITGYDILRTLTLLRGYSGKIAMMSYLNATQGADHIGQLLDMDLTLYEINKEVEIEEKIKKAFQEGIKVIIGDVISTEVANKVGIQGILITSGTEAVIEIIEEAERMLFYVSQHNKELERITSVLDQIDAGILIFDRAHNCTVKNQKIKNQLNSSYLSKPFNIQNLVEIVPQLERFHFTNGSGVQEITVVHNDNQLTFKKVPLANVEGFALIVRGNHWNENNSKKDYTAHYHFNSLIMDGESTEKLIESARKISHSHLPIVIYGEPGVGKKSLGQAIHNESERKAKNYVYINCEAYSEIQLEREFFGYEGEKIIRGVFEIADQGTLFIDAIDKLSISLQGKLFNVINTKEVTRINGSLSIPIDVRIISTASESLEQKIAQLEFREDLYYVINVFILKVPPLRERMEDLENLIRLLIASINVTNVKQIIGFRPKLMSVLKGLQWPGNIPQLKNIVEQMCMISKGPFIELNEVEPIFKKLISSETENRNKYLDFNNKTLEQLELEIIMRVLGEEDYNQSKTAARLGINRTTLWRKIKIGNKEI